MAKHKRLKPIGDYLYDKGEMIEQMFSSIPIVEIRNMVPIKLQGMPLHELKAECLVELLGISDREILNILNGKKEKTPSSSDSELEGTFVISDDEKNVCRKKIKKEKNESMRKIKTERVSSKKKDGSSRSSLEPGTSKKKRKSKEIVEASSKKKKKSTDNPAPIPSSSKDVSKVSASRKKKEDKIKEYKKIDSSKNKDEGDVVVLDDSDQEEKHEQKSLLDLLELEMRARAIRSLLKKEEAVQAQKILSEYKDEPDDLIPIDVEPPQIELLSDSDGEEHIGPQENKDTEKTHGTSYLEMEDSLDNPEGSSKFSLVVLDNESNNVPALAKKIDFSETNETTNESTPSPVTTEGKGDFCDVPRLSQIEMSDCDKNNGLCYVKNDDDHDSIKSVVSDNSCQAELADGSGSPSRCSLEEKHSFSSEGKIVLNESNASKIQSPVGNQSSPSEESTNEMGNNHFLVIEESPLVHVVGGSEIEKSTVEANETDVEIIKYSDENTIACSAVTVDYSADCKGFQRLPFADDPELNIMNGEAFPEVCDSNYTFTKLQKSIGNQSTDSVHFDRESCSTTPGAHVSLCSPICEQSEEMMENSEQPQFEGEVLDYDYDPTLSCCQKDGAYNSQSSQNISHSETSFDCAADPSVSCHRSADRVRRKKPGKQECIPHKTRENCSSYDSENGSLTHTDDDESERNVSRNDLVAVPLLLNPNVIESDSRSPLNKFTVVLHDDSSFKSSLNQVETFGLNDEGPIHSVPLLLSGSSESEAAKISNDIPPSLIPSDEAALIPKLDSEEGTDTVESLSHCDTLNRHVHENESHTCLLTLPSSQLEEECKNEDRKSPEKKASVPEQSLMAAEVSFDLNSDALQNKASNSSISGDGSVSEGAMSNIMCISPISKSTGEEAPLLAAELSCPAELEERDKLSVSISHDDVDASVPAGACGQSTLVPEECNIVLSPVEMSVSNNGQVIEDRQIPDHSAISIFSGADTPSLGVPPSVHDECIEVEMVDENRTQGVTSSEINCSSNGGVIILPTPSRNVFNLDVAEIIDITDADHDDAPDAVYVSEVRVDSDSLYESDNEISDKAAEILEQMTNILNEETDEMGVRSSADQPSLPTYVPADVISASVDNASSEPDDISEKSDSSENGNSTAVEVIDSDDVDEEDTDHEVTSNSSDPCSRSSMEESFVQIIDDSESVCSVDSNADNTKSDDCIITVQQPKDYVSDDCIIVMPPDRSNNNNKVTVPPMPLSSESDDCMVVSEHNDSVIDESVEKSSCETFDDGTTDIKTTEKPSDDIDKKNIMVTVIIEDDDGEEEEVQLLTQEVPAEILELDDDDEARTNWTARWLESDNVKKVVQTSKILTNVRKQMKMKLKKIEAPTTNVPQHPEEKSAPSLIGSVEEYHRLVKQGVIFSKATKDGEKPEASVGAIQGSFDSPRDLIEHEKESSDSVPAKRKDEKCREKKLNSTKSGKKKKSDKVERTEKSERKNESIKRKKNDKKLAAGVCPGFTPSTDTKQADKMVEKSPVLEIMHPAEKPADQEEGEIIECDDENPPINVRNQKERENERDEKIMGRVLTTGVRTAEQESKKVIDSDEREEGEISDEEEGEISDSGGESDGKESEKSSQSKPSSSLPSKAPSRSKSPLSSIPLPQKPPVKQQSAKTPERNAVAKRFILRNLQLGKKKPAKSKSKKKRNRGAGRGNKKGLGYSSNTAPRKNKHVGKGTQALPVTQKEVVCSLSSNDSSFQNVQGVQPSYPETYPGLAHPGSTMQQGCMQSTSLNVSNTAQMYDSYYSWAYSQGLINSASGNYGYGTPESVPDPNVYKQWEEYYRKLMEACKVSAEHASAGTLYSLPSSTEKSGYTWVFDHSSTTSQPVETPASTDLNVDAAQVLPPIVPSEDSSEVSQSVAPVTNEMSDKDRFESWQYRFGLKGLLKEHFVPGPAAPPGGN